MAASSVDSALEPGDKFAKALADWRGRELPEWEREFEVWDGKTALRHPPHRPTVGRKGRTTNDALKKLRVTKTTKRTTGHFLVSQSWFEAAGACTKAIAVRNKNSIWFKPRDEALEGASTRRTPKLAQEGA